MVVALIGTTTIFAQSWTDRWTDDSYLPEEGDWSIGFDATSSLNYFGNLLNSSAAAPTSDYVGEFENAIYGKLVTSDTEAWRVRLGMKMYKVTDNTKVEDVLATSNGAQGATVTNKNTIGETDIKLWFGKEFRRGSTRLQGVYGAETGLGITSTTEKNDYGNSAQFGGVGMVEDKSGMNLGISLRGFIGFEYFMMPKISIGGEYGWGFSFISKGGGNITSKSWETNSSGNSYEKETKTELAGDSELGFENDNATGSLVIRMYF